METAVKKPEVSIMICAYNSARFLPDAIDSVLDQTYSDWELLILDDASTDSTPEVAAKYLSDKRVRYIRHEHNIGITANRNFALKESKGAYIAVLDSDDVWADNSKLQQQVAFLGSNADHMLVGTGMTIIDEEGKKVGANKNIFKISRLIYLFKNSNKIERDANDSAIRNNFLITNQIIQSSVVYRKDIAINVGGYDASLYIWEDWDLWLKLGLEGKLHNLHTKSILYRDHLNNISYKDKRKGVETALKIIRKYKNTYPHYVLGWMKLRLKLLLFIFNQQ